MFCHMIKHDRFLLDNLRLSSDIFGNLQNFSENVHQKRTTFGESSEIFGKSSKKLLLVYLKNKQNNTWLPVVMEFPFSCST